MADVFISYHEKSAGGIVRNIAAALGDVGVSSWYAERDLTDPGAFAATITREIRACKIFLLVLDNGSNQSEHVKSEVHLAFQRISKHQNMKPFYFKIDGCTLSDDMLYYLSRFQITDGNPPDEQRIRELVKQISDIIHPAPPTWKMVKDLNQKIQDLQQKQNQKIRDLRQQQLQQIQAMNRVKAQNRKTIQEMYQENSQLRQENTQLYREQGRARERAQRRKRIIVSFSAVLVLIILSAFGYLHNHTVGILDRNGTLRIYGIGNMKEISCPLQSVKREQIYAVIISDGLTSIERWSFKNCINLTSVIVPNSITNIGNGAFYACYSLTSVSLPENVNLGSIAFPSTTTIIRRSSPE